VNGIAPENWLSHGMPDGADAADELDLQGPELSRTSSDEGDEKESDPDDESGVSRPLSQGSDPYLQVSSHWMAPGKNFSKQRGIDNSAKRAHLIRIETIRASVENAQIERESEFFVPNPDSPPDSPFKAF
jgi:hypothetical protein